MKRDIQQDMKRVSVNIDYMELFVIINNTGMKINADVNARIG